jgi:hypothetical protein
MKIMLEADKFIYVLFCEAYIHATITKMMYFSRHHIGSVCWDNVTTDYAQQEIQLEQPKCALLLVDNGNVVLPSSLTYQQIYRVT